MSISIRESFSAEQTEHALGPDPFSPKRLRLLRALTDAIFSEAPADLASRQENDELVASFAGAASWPCWLRERITLVLR